MKGTAVSRIILFGGAPRGWVAGWRFSEWRLFMHGHMHMWIRTCWLICFSPHPTLISSEIKRQDTHQENQGSHTRTLHLLWQLCRRLTVPYHRRAGRPNLVIISAKPCNYIMYILLYYNIVYIGQSQPMTFGPRRLTWLNSFAWLASETGYTLRSSCKRSKVRARAKKTLMLAQVYVSVYLLSWEGMRVA